ncbi:MAG: S8 family serine peptidase [Lachnospiraceae bacterium]|nr:S8 family serine peptidase [Lachnospiraceae bacterium]
MSQKFENLWNLALETQKSVREKTNDLNVGYIQEENAWEVIVKYHGEIGFLEEYGIGVEELIAGYGILKVPASLVEMLALVEQIEYVEKPKRYYFEEMLPGENSCVYPVTLGEGALTGADILIAIPDSGIDYRRREFRNADGSSRILYLWDQTLVPGEIGAPPAGFRTGVEFSKEQIDAALRQEGTEGFLSVPSRDVSGHGTAVAGIAAAGRVRMEDGGIYQGVAPESQLIVVKLGTPGESDFPGTTEIMRAVTYAVRKGIELGKPVVINLSFGNSYGSHDGSTLVERFLDNASEIGRTVICVGAGNEGDSGGHFAGDIENVREVEIAVGEYERSLSIQLWNQFGDVYEIRLQAPDNTVQVLSDTVGEGKQEFMLNGTGVLVYLGEPKPYSVLQEIYFELVAPEGQSFIASGIWKLEMVPVRVVTGKFDCYLPASEARSSRTFFLRATPEMTLTVPSTASKIVTVGAYNASFEQYAAFSGRGLPQVSRENSLTIAGLIKPDLVAPGVDILAPDVRGGFGQVTGTSFATPIVSGSAALLMEWGIVRGNDRYLYGEKVKAYLRRGAQPLRGENIYPNERVGFGKLCVAESFPVL